MTLLVGIKTNQGIERIVLAADRQLSEGDDKEEIKQKRPVQKLFYGELGKDGYWAMGWCGSDYRETMQFYKDIREGNPPRGKNIIEEAIEKGWFEGVRQLNTEITKKPDAGVDDTVAFLLAVTKPKLNLWLVDEFGHLKGVPEEHDFDYIVAGGGAKVANEYIKQQMAEERINRGRIDSWAAYALAKRTILAGNSVGTVGFGYDLVVLSKDVGIKDWGEDTRRELKRAEKSMDKKAMEEYVVPERPEEE